MNQGSTRRWLGLAAWLAVTFLAAAFGSQFQPGPWYDALSKPAWTPPDWLFGPVWTLLYLLMALAAWLVWKAHGFPGARPALGFYLLQLAANAAWSWVFFGRQDIGGGLGVIVTLWALIAVTLWLFLKHDRTAGSLLVPYLLWVTYAGALNFQLLRLNA